MMSHILIATVVFIVSGTSGANLTLDKFPPSFVFGVSSSAFPTEGAWDIDGKGHSIWDEFTKNRTNVQDGTDAKTAADGYHNVQADVQLLKWLKVSHYKFSLSWPRILPSGTIDNINGKGINYYKGLINTLLASNITPFVTLHHWDLPQKLQDHGGWANESSVSWFKNYADLCFSTFGDRVKFWTTIDDPVTLAYKGHETGEHAPGLKKPELVYVIGHNLIRAHAEAYALYSDRYKAAQKGKVGITLNSDWFVSKTKDVLNTVAVERALAFRLGWFANPLFNGDYPTVMKNQVVLKRTQAGVPQQKMPEFTAAEKVRVKGATDFLAIGHFKTKIVSHKINSGIGFLNDQDILLETDTSYPKLEYRPEINPNSSNRLMGFGLKNILNYVTTSYNKPAIYVTHNGLGTCGTLKDQNRVDYIKEYSNNVFQAIKAGSDVRGYFAWSLVDGFDWNHGYTSKTGLYFVDMGSQNRKRHRRSSTKFYTALIVNRGLNVNLTNYRAYPADRDKFYFGKFPDKFLWGVATSAYQIEGAWNIDGSFDFLGINHYNTHLVANKPNSTSAPNYEQDQGLDIKTDPCWGSTQADWLKVNPWGIRKILTWAKEHYNNPTIFITGSGRPSEPGLDDPDRIYYYKYYINELLKAIKLDNVDVRGYTAWSLMDSLEWTSGFYSKYGLYHVDFDSPNKTRTPRASAKFYKHLIAENGFSNITK